jgi:hypothetical protein
MDIKKSLTMLTVVMATAMAQQSPGPVNNPEVNRLLGMSEAEQKAYVNSAFDHGLPQASIDSLTGLVRQRSAILVPVLGARVLEAVKSPKPIDCFADKTVDPQAAIMAATSAIAYAADGNALKELSKLLEVDDRRFGWLIGYTLSDGGSRNFFPVAYRGFEIGSRALDAKMIIWIQKQLEDDAESSQPQLRAWWADALVEKNGHAPTEAEWVSDPIEKRLKPELAKSLHDDIFHLAADVARGKKEPLPRF